MLSFATTLAVVQKRATMEEARAVDIISVMLAAFERMCIHRQRGAPCSSDATTTAIVAPCEGYK
jgi:hypothetical protein